MFRTLLCASFVFSFSSPGELIAQTQTSNHNHIAGNSVVEHDDNVVRVSSELAKQDCDCCVSELDECCDPPGIFGRGFPVLFPCRKRSVCNCVPSTSSCSSFSSSNTRITLHIKSDQPQVNERLGLFRRPTMNIVPATPTTAVRAPVANTLGVYQPVAVALQPVAMQAVAMQPTLQPVSFAQLQRPTVQLARQQNNATSSCCNELDEKLTKLADEVEKVSSRVNKLIGVVDRHDKILDELVKRTR